MIQDTPEGTTHYYNDGCGIKEHNMTLRDKWEVYALSTIADHDELNTNDVFRWFLAQFDEMLAEDIEKMKERIKSNHLGISFDYGVEECIDYLEARRLSIKE